MAAKYIASVIIPTYNRSALLKMSLATLGMQTISKNDFEVIIVDDGSIDNTSVMIDEFRKILNIQYFFVERKGFGVVRARNIGIDNSCGKVCIFIDSGVLLASNAIEEHIKSHDSKIKYGVIGYMYGFDS